MDYPDFRYEEELIDKGYIPCGIDDVGTGCLAYDVTAAAVVVPLEAVKHLKGKVKDSKKLSKKRREELNDLILDICECSIYSVGNTIIDDVNILEAVNLAMCNSTKGLSSCTFALVDGASKIGLDIPNYNIIKGDNKSISIACASIIAKVDRDARMRIIAEEYPGYGFETNMGYGTKEGKHAIIKYGVTKYHRLSFKGVKEFV